MKLKLLSFCFVLITIFATVACDKEPEPRMIIQAFTEGGYESRTSLQGNNEGGYEVIWNQGDNISIAGFQYSIVKGEGTAYAIFEGPMLDDGNYIAVYATPHENVIPEYQKFGKTGTISNVPMQAEVTVKDGKASIASFKNIGGLLRLELFTSYMFKCCVKTVCIYSCLDSVKSNYTLDFDEAMDMKQSANKSFYVCLPEGVYGGESGILKIIITDSTGHMCMYTLKSTSVLEIKRSQMTVVRLELRDLCIDNPPASQGTESFRDESQETISDWFTENV